MSSSGWTEAELQAVHHHRLGIAIFHDGNPGHLWRGEVASRLGETVLAAGALMWLWDLIGTPFAVALALVALGLPFLLAPALVARFEQSPEPATPLKWIGRVRLLFALALIAMHYHTILPVVYALLFFISLCGRLHDGARVAAMRTCLAPGEPEQVANDTHIGVAVAAVLGPLIATLCYVITGERILGVSIGAAIFFLISLNSESFLDALEPRRRAFLLATPESVALDDDALDALAHEDDDADEDPEERRELKLPEWYQEGPATAGEALGDIRAGLALAGGSSASSAALWALSVLALVGGGLSVLEVFYLTGIMMLPTLYLGPLLASEGAGMALGVVVGGALLTSIPWRMVLVVGLVGAGVAVAALSVFRVLPAALVVALGLGLANAFAVMAARHALLAGFDAVERRALAASEGWMTALCGIAGAAIFTLAFTKPADMPIHLPARLMPAWPLSILLALMGASLVASGPILAVLSESAPRRKPKAKASGKSKGALSARARGRKSTSSDDEDEEHDDLDAADSAYLPATGEHRAWDDEDGDDGEWDQEEDDYAEPYPADETGYGDAYDTGSYDGRSGRDRSRSARRPLPRNQPPRW